MINANKPKAYSAAQAGDIHAHIESEAGQLRKAARTGFQDASATPALSAMLDSARMALDQSIPKSFEHEGRTYWLRVALPMVRIMVFDTPTTFKPMAFALSGSGEEFGHAPGH
ncbi:MAG: hypothetical protein WCK81_15705 [Betaproteobacteria bacterium]